MKKLSSLFPVLLGVFFSLSVYGQNELLLQSYAFYPLDGDCNDYSGNGYHAVGQDVTPADGYLGFAQTSLYHNGATSRINRPYLNLGDTIVLAAWIYSESNLQNSSLVYNGNPGFDGYGLFIKDASGTFPLGRRLVVVQGGLSENILDTSYRIPFQTWTHVALVVRKNKFDLYVNGFLRGSGVRPFNPPTSNFNIGMTPEQQQNGNFPAFKGRIDDVSVFTVNPTPEFMYRLYNEGIVTHSAPPLSMRVNHSVSPNPARNKVRISGAAIESVQVSDARGRDVSSLVRSTADFQGASIQTDQLPEGLYYVNIQSPAGVSVVKFQKI